MNSGANVMATVTERVIGPSPALELYRMTVDEYERMATARVLIDPRVELINGYLVQKMTKKPRHVWAVESIRDVLDANLGTGCHVREEKPVRIPDFDEPEPDLAIVRGTRADLRGRHPGPGDLALIVEVSETSLDRDQGEKLSAYARGGVPVYWVVNLIDGRVEVYSDPDQAAGRYRARADFGPGDPVPVILDGREVCRVDVGSLL
jgi:Uma2 family endonuclease